MKKISVNILLPDNGGIVYFTSGKAYLCASLEPTEVGTILLAMMTDLQLSESGKRDFDIEIDNVQF